MINVPHLPEDVLATIDSRRKPRPFLESPFVPPRNETEGTVAACWAEVLGLQVVGVTDDFFDLGGDSLHMVRILSRLRDRYGVEIPLGEFFDNPTSAGLARVLEGAAQT